MAVDFHIVRRIGEHGSGPVITHKRRICGLIARIAANQPMRPAQPDFARLRDRGARFWLRHLISGIIGSIDVIIQQQVQFGGFKAGEFQIEIQIHFGKSLEFDFQNLAIPSRQFGQTVVCDHIGPPLGGRQMRQLDCRHFFHAQLFCSCHAAVAGDDTAVAIDQNRVGEAEVLDRRRNLIDLFGAMCARIARVGNKIISLAIDDLQPGLLRQGLGQCPGFDISHFRAFRYLRSRFAVTRTRASYEKPVCAVSG